MKKILTVGILICLLCAMLPIQALAVKETVSWTEVDEEGNEHTYVFEFDTDDLTSKDIVWVQIHPDYIDHEYTVEDFSEVNCVGVEELVIEYPDYDKLLLRLTLGDYGLENVYRAVEILGKRQDILQAFPEFLYVPYTADTILISVSILMLFSGTGLFWVVSKKKKIA